jgi:hypothetical protein
VAVGLALVLFNFASPHSVKIQVLFILTPILV